MIVFERLTTNGETTIPLGIVAITRFRSALALLVLGTFCGASAQQGIVHRHCSLLEPACQSRSQATDSSGTFVQWFSTVDGITATASTVDANNQIYIGGISFGGLPVTPNGFQQSSPLAPAFYDGALLKLDSTGSKVLYGTYLNGLRPRQIVVDNAGFTYILALHTEQTLDYTQVTYPAPITTNAVQPYPGTGLTPTLLKIAPTGELVYATFLGGVSALQNGAVAVDSQGSAVVCGSTDDPGLVATPGAFQAILHNNYDVFVAKLSPDGTSYEAFTFIGGDGVDRCAGIQLDSAGNVYLYGDTNSRFFPVTAGAYQTTRGAGTDLFVSKLDQTLSKLLWSTYVGGDYDTVAQPLEGGGPPDAESIALAADGSVLFTANTQAFDFPVTADTGPPSTSLESKPLVGVLDPTGSHLLLSYPLPVSGAVRSVVTGDGQDFYMTGWATIGNLNISSTLNAEGSDTLLAGSFYPTTYIAEFSLPSGTLTYLGPVPNISLPNGIVPIGYGVRQDGGLIITSLGDVFELNFSGQKQPLLTELTNPASLLPSLLVPGQITEMRGVGLANVSSPAVAPDMTNPPVELAGTQVMIDGVAAPLLSVSSNRILALAPDQAPAAKTSVIVVSAGGTQGDPRTVGIVATSPGLLTASSIGVGQALATNGDGTANSPSNPAQKGQMLRLYATGLGVTTANGAPQAAITATVSGVSAQVQNVAPAVGYPAGYMAIDIQIPSGVPQSDFILVNVAADGVSSQAGVTVSIR